MARVFTEGFEHGTRGPFSGGNVITSNPTPRSGQYAFMVPSDYQWAHIPALNELYLRIGVNLRAYSSRSISLRSQTDAVIGRIEFINGLMKLWVGSTVVRTAPCRHFEWFLLEWHLKIADSGGVSEVRVDGETVMTFTGDTKPGTEGYVAKLGIENLIAADDIAINDTSGSENNSWCGDGRIFPLIPSGDVLVQWSPSSGSVNYEMVDEIPPDGDTTFVYTDKDGKVDKYSVTGSLPTLIRGVRGVIVYAQAKALTGEALGLRLGVDSNGSESWSGTITLPTSWAIVNSGLITKDPATGQDWTVEGVQNSRVAIKSV